MNVRVNIYRNPTDVGGTIGIGGTDILCWLCSWVVVPSLNFSFGLTAFISFWYSDRCLHLWFIKSVKSIES
jgi:hypothetical protein